MPAIFDQYPIRVLKNDTIKLIESFLSGTKFSVDLSQTTLQTFDRSNELNYVECLNHVKGLLNTVNHNGVAKNVYVIEDLPELSTVELAMVIRYINVCHHDRYIIVLNGEIVYIPDSFSGTNTDELRMYVNRCIQEYKIRISKFKVPLALYELFVIFHNLIGRSNSNKSTVSY